MGRCSCLVSIVCCLGLIAPELGAEETATANVEKFAQRISVVGADDFLHGFRPRRWNRKENADALSEFAAYIRAVPVGQLTPLLKHEFPKVRTLAAVALYDKEDAKLLPLLLPLLKDNAATFPESVPIARTLGMNEPEPTRPRTVSDGVQHIFKAYMDAAGYYYGVEGVNQQPGFEDYWQKRSQRSYCASWFAVKLARASFASSPTPPDRRDAIHKVRQEIDAVPQPDRTWILLWLRSENGADVLVTDEELVAMLRALDHDTLLKTLRNALPSDDPDLKPRTSNNYPYHCICLFILKHAGELLQPGDALELLEREKKERDAGNSDPLVHPAWATAAAALKSAEAKKILSDAHERFSGEYDGEHRLALAEALWDVNGEPDAATAVDWFYAELKTPPQVTHALSTFLATIAQQKRASHAFMAALVKDARFEQLNWKSLEILAKTVNAYGVGEVVSAQELSSTWSPFGLDFFMKDADASMQHNPKETQTMIDRLAAWRTAIRASLPKWAPAK